MAANSFSKITDVYAYYVTVFESHKRFCDGRDIEDEKSSERQMLIKN